MKFFRLLIISVWLLILYIFTVTNIYYLYNKSIWKWNTDCMIEYINKYYPNWEIYDMNWEQHVDKIWLNYWQSKWQINWCYFPNDLWNSVYCSTTLFWETLLNNK
jgi:hypothetical protein